MKWMSRQKCEDRHPTARSPTTETRLNLRCCLATLHGSCSSIASVAAFLVISSWKHHLAKTDIHESFLAGGAAPSCLLRSWECENARQNAGWKEGTSLVRKWVNHKSWLWGFVQMQGRRQLPMVTKLVGCRDNSLLRLAQQDGWGDCSEAVVWGCGSGKKTTNQEHRDLEIILFPYETQMEE